MIVEKGWAGLPDDVKVENNLPNRYTIRIGDFYDDGHGKYHDLIFKTNLNEEEICSAYQKAVDDSGVDLALVCNDYEDNKIDQEDMAKMNHVGINTSMVDECNGEYELFYDSFAELILSFIEYGNSNFLYEQDEENVINMFEGFGYGLFH